MELRKKIIYGIFVVSVAYGFYFHVIREGDVRRGPVDENSAAGTSILAAGLPGSETASVGTEPSSVRIISDDWNRNPFGNQRSRREPARNNSGDRPRLAPPQLTAVSISAGKGMAVVNGQITEVGRTVGPWRLIRITQDAALFEGPDGQVWVKLGG